jgi:NAD/NADP transhydrogenase alpha subunit
MFLVKLAAEAGGNCAATVPGELVVKNGVTIIGILTFFIGILDWFDALE